jgi:hypothetical protein
LKSICKRYEYEFEGARDPLNEIVNTIFPRVEQIFLALPDDDSLKSAVLKAKIAKILYTSNQLSLCNRYKSEDGLTTLINFYTSNMRSHMDESLKSLTEDSNERDRRTKTP